MAAAIMADLGTAEDWSLVGDAASGTAAYQGDVQAFATELEWYTSTNRLMGVMSSICDGIVRRAAQPEAQLRRSPE